jgi:hypothetical protein
MVERRGKGVVRCEWLAIYIVVAHSGAVRSLSLWRLRLLHLLFPHVCRKSTLLNGILGETMLSPLASDPSPSGPLISVTGTVA